MRRGVARVTQALAVGFVLGATAAQAQITISVDDLRTLEGNAPFALNPGIAVRVSGPPTVSINVPYTVQSGSAVAGTDFLAVPASGVLSFPAFSSAPQYITGIQILGNTFDQWSPTLMQDRAFFVQLGTPTPAAGGVLDKSRGTVTIIDDDHPNAGVQFFSVVSTGTATIGQNKLQWRVPSGAATVRIVWKQGVGSCAFPSDTDLLGDGWTSVVAGSAGALQYYTHTSLTIGTSYCYSVFAFNGAGMPSSGADVPHVKATPIDTTGKILWAYATGAASVVPPSVGADAIYTTDSSGVVHAMSRVTPLGEWPSGWNPVAVGKPTQNRSAVVPMGSRTRLFLGTDGGGVHAIDGKTGTIVWSRSSTFGLTQLPSGGGLQAQPAGLFKSFTGNNDMLLVGANNGASSTFFALDPATGNNLVAAFSNPFMSGVMGQAVVDYAKNRVYFLTTAASATLFSLDLGPVGTPTLALSTLPGGNPLTFTGSNGSAVLRNSHLVWGDTVNKVLGFDLTTGTAYSAVTGDGAVKGFLWPDRRNTQLYFSTNNNVQCLRDNGTSFSSCAGVWPVAAVTPSMVLQIPGTDYIFVGDGQGRLVEINVSTMTSTPLLLENGVQIGSPSLDGPNGVLVVGSASGTIYGVRVPY